MFLLQSTDAKTNAEENLADRAEDSESQEPANPFNDASGESQNEDTEEMKTEIEPRKDTPSIQVKTSRLIPSVWEKVTKSYKETAQNLDDFVKNKLEYVASLRL